MRLDLIHFVSMDMYFNLFVGGFLLGRNPELAQWGSEERLVVEVVNQTMT